jgi:hypothetical protein
MPLLLLALGLIFLASAVRGTTKDLFALLQGDFTGSQNFLVWTGAIVGVGALGYIKQIRPIANALLGLILVAIVLANKGVFANFKTAFMSTTKAAPQGAPQPSQPGQPDTGEYSATPMLQSPVYPTLPTPSLTLSPYSYGDSSVDPLTLF